jgi:hypothetical protein
MQSTTTAARVQRRASGKEVQVVTFRAWGHDLALPMESVRGIHRWQEQERIEIAAPPKDLDVRPDSDACSRTLHVATQTGLKAVPVGAIAEITPVWVERRAGTPAWALGTTRVGTRELLVLDPARL